MYNIYYFTSINKKLYTDRKTYWYIKKKTIYLIVHDAVYVGNDVILRGGKADCR